MKKLFIIANWKSNKTSLETKDWFQGISNFQFPISNKEIILCPAFTLLSNLKSYIVNPPAGEAGHKSSLKLGAQDISPFESGAYTGEVSAKQIKEFADYVIVGHSERRQHFHETEEIIIKKLEMAQKYQIKPIFCISDISQIHNSSFIVPKSNIIIAYEPLSAIGSGQADTPENASNIASQIKKIVGEIPVLYGGSVTSENVASFTKTPYIDGVLVGNASLDAQEFLTIIAHA